MNIVFLASATPDLQWFRLYYNGVFADGRSNAQTHFRKARLGLLANPYLGQLLENTPAMRELAIPRTPFALVYYVSGQEIRIVRLWDGRSQRPQQWL